jgi:hypothetical protein
MSESDSHKSGFQVEASKLAMLIVLLYVTKDQQSASSKSNCYSDEQPHSFIRNKPIGNEIGNVPDTGIYHEDNYQYGGND